MTHASKLATWARTRIKELELSEHMFGETLAELDSLDMDPSSKEVDQVEDALRRIESPQCLFDLVRLHKEHYVWLFAMLPTEDRILTVHLPHGLARIKRFDLAQRVACGSTPTEVRMDRILGIYNELAESRRTEPLELYVRVEQTLLDTLTFVKSYSTTGYKVKLPGISWNQLMRIWLGTLPSELVELEKQLLLHDLRERSIPRLVEAINGEED